MIKGCQKRMIKIKDTKSIIFEEAYFVLRNEIADSVSKKDIISEATAIINKYSQPSRPTKKVQRPIKNLLWLFSGAIIGAAVLFCISLLI